SDTLNRQRPSHIAVACVRYLAQVDNRAWRHSQNPGDFAVDGFVVEPHFLGVVIEVPARVFDRQEQGILTRVTVNGRERLGSPDRRLLGIDPEHLTWRYTRTSG